MSLKSRVKHADAVQNLRRAVLAPPPYTPNIQQALRTVNFKFHRSCSFAEILRECNVGEGRTLLMFWACERSESKATMSMSASSCSSLHTPLQSTPLAQSNHRVLRSTAQQTEISCRYSPGISSPGTDTKILLLYYSIMHRCSTVLSVLVLLSEADEQRLLRATIADSLTLPSPASSLLQPGGRSMSILGSVCALLLTKQGSSAVPKEVCSLSGSRVSEHICRICFGGESAERLVRPCSCRGTIAAVHRSCLERWLLQAATSYCELCRHHYVVTRTHKWSWLRSVAQWAASGRGRALAGDLWRGAALGAASVLGTARALHACDRVLQAGARRGGSAALAANLLSSLLIGIIGALNGLLTTWMLLKIQEHQLSWQAWRDSTLHVHVTLPEPPSPARSDTTVVAPPPPTPPPSPPRGPTADRSTNVADPFMVAPPRSLPDT